MSGPRLSQHARLSAWSGPTTRSAPMRSPASNASWRSSVGRGDQRARQRMDDALNDEIEALAVLERLIGQLSGSGYQDRHGNPIELNLAYRDALALLELNGRTP